ncbi:MAG: toxin-antitoxin system, antitoxin component, Xre family protein [Deltaproteobacteria bacterium]|nr:toxin-antitoxin system, antitoxin component, Xre family protein [Deltaproteobacteria bacterium]
MFVKEMIKKEVDRLPESLAAEVYDLIIFMKSRNEKANLSMGAQAPSAPSFPKIWDNEEDAVYDKL